jgi:hypothetical protein
MGCTRGAEPCSINTIRKFDTDTRMELQGGAEYVVGAAEVHPHPTRTGYTGGKALWVSGGGGSGGLWRTVADCGCIKLEAGSGGVGGVTRRDGMREVGGGDRDQLLAQLREREDEDGQLISERRWDGAS